MTVPELLSTLEKAIFKEVDGQSKDTKISPFRQNLQDVYVRRLSDLALGDSTPFVIAANSTARKLAAHHLKLVAEKCAAATGRAGLDEETRAHLESIAKRADMAAARDPRPYRERRLRALARGRLASRPVAARPGARRLRRRAASGAAARPGSFVTPPLMVRAPCRVVVPRSRASRSPRLAPGETAPSTNFGTPVGGFHTPQER